MSIEEDDKAIMKRIKDVIYLQRTSPNFAMYCVNHVTDHKHSFLFYNDDQYAGNPGDTNSKRSRKSDYTYWARKRYVELLDDARSHEHKSAMCDENTRYSSISDCNSTYDNRRTQYNASNDVHNDNGDNITKVFRRNEEKEKYECQLSYNQQLATGNNSVALFRPTWHTHLSVSFHCSNPDEHHYYYYDNDYNYHHHHNHSKYKKQLEEKYKENHYIDSAFTRHDNEQRNGDRIALQSSVRHLNLHDIRHIWNGLHRLCERFAAWRNNPTWLSQPPPYIFTSFQELTSFVKETLECVVNKEREKLIVFVEHITKTYLIHTEAILYTFVYIIEELLSFTREQWSCEDKLRVTDMSESLEHNTMHVHNLSQMNNSIPNYDYEEAAGTVFYLILILFETHRKRECAIHTFVNYNTAVPEHENDQIKINTSDNRNSAASVKSVISQNEVGDDNIKIKNNNVNENKIMKNIYYQAAFEEYCVKAVEAMLYHHHQHQRRQQWERKHLSHLNTSKSCNMSKEHNVLPHAPENTSQPSPLFDFVVNVLESWRDEQSFSLSTALKLREMYIALTTHKSVEVNER